MAKKNGDYLEVFKPRKGSSLALKPCPFCGSNHINYVKYKCTAGGRWKVRCTDCMAHTKRIVQSMWNRRV